MSNYFISYDLNVPGKDYEVVYRAIKALGGWARVHKSLWYVSSPATSDQVYAAIAPAFDKSDQFMVITAINAQWNDLPANVDTHIKSNWNR